MGVDMVVRDEEESSEKLCKNQWKTFTLFTCGDGGARMKEAHLAESESGSRIFKLTRVHITLESRAHENHVTEGNSV